MISPPDLQSLLALPAFKTFFDAAPDAIVIVDSGGHIAAYNEKSHELFAAKVDELTGMLVEQLIPSAARARHVGLRQNYLARPVPRPMGVNMQLSALRLDGSVFPVEISLAPLRIGDGNAVMAIVRDITDRLEHRDTVRELDRTKAIAQVTQAALIEKDFDQLSQFSCATVRNMLSAHLVCVVVHNHMRAGIRLCAVEADQSFAPGASARLAGGIAEISVRLGEVALIKDTAAAGFELSAECALLDVRSLAGTPIRSQGGLIGTLLACSRSPHHFSRDDLAFLEVIANILSNAYQRSRAEEATQSARRLELIGQLTGGIAHDFNNMLTVVLGNMQLLTDMVSGNEFAARSVAATERAAQRGAVLTRKLLAFSRRQPLQPAVIDVAKHLHACFELFDRTLGANIKVQLMLAQQLPPVEIDAMQLESALLNLAVNARDAMQPQGGTLVIEARAHEHSDGVLSDGSRLAAGRYVVITVADTGVGMSAEVLGHVFEPFFTTKPIGEGTGLGLAMVYGFVKQSNGHITVQSAAGYGTTFSLYFPAVDTTGLPSGHVARGKLSAAPRGNNEHVLVVEDDAEVARIAQTFLLDIGYRVSVAHTHEGALSTFNAAADIALVVSDVVLADGESGVQLARALVALRPGLPVLYCSGYARHELPTAFDINDKSLFLRKPFTREQLASAAAAALRRGAPQ